MDLRQRSLTRPGSSAKTCNLLSLSYTDLTTADKDVVCFQEPDLSIFDDDMRLMSQEGEIQSVRIPERSASVIMRKRHVKRGAGHDRQRTPSVLER